MRSSSSSSDSNAAAAAAAADTVGILALEVYTPSTFIRQADLEQHSGVAAGKYTIGLGQEGLAVTGDAEDINSICLTAVANLLEKYNIDPATVGRLEVGTETLVDKSKSTKTVLLDLFPPHCTDIEGATVVNACYGGTAALLNAFQWVESAAWDGRYAIVVAADIATYARGPARPTCGCGAVAVLVGRDAPLVYNARLRATHASNTWDFFKPDHTVEYPVVDGALSQTCYYRALEDCYVRFCDKMMNNKDKDDAELFTAESPDFFVFHAPYNKLVQKSYARLFLCDARRKQAGGGGIAPAVEGSEADEKKQDTGSSADVPCNGHAAVKSNNKPSEHAIPDEYLVMPVEDTYENRALEGVLKAISAESFRQRLTDANRASQLVGNTYTASVFLGLASLVDRASERLTPGKSIVVFSYGSGAIATMYRLQIREPTSQTKFTIQKMAATMDLTNRLQQREQVGANELDYALEARARMHRAGAPYSPVYPTVGRLFPGTFYLNGVDSKWRRSYSRVPIDATMAVPGTPLASPIVLRLSHRDSISHPVTGKLQVLAAADTGTADHITEARRRVACVITGTAAGLPGSEVAFQSDNLQRLIDGNQCITPIPVNGISAMLEKNVVQNVRQKDGTTKRVPVDTESEAIKLAAQLGSFDLTTSYGVSEGLAKTMDVAAQVAVAAGMEALKDAGLVSGRSNDPKEWLLPEQYRDTTGVVYASSFPAMDAAVGEVMRFLKSKTVDATNSAHLIATLRSRLLRGSSNGNLSDDDEAALAQLAASVNTCNGEGHSSKPYEFDRKFLFRVLVLGNAQLAQLAGCRGPNTQTNAACAGTTQAIAMAQDMLISGRAERVVVVAGDNASGDTLLPWLGSGFRALGAACTKGVVEDAAMPFDKRRSGMLLGAGGIGMVLETEISQIDRQLSSPYPFQVKARLLATQYSNSAYHGAALDRKHISSEFKRFLSDIELLHGICKAEIASHGVYLSHETSTHASDASSCSGNEVSALRDAFGDDLLSKMLILNTKGFTGHPMGVSFEDVVAVEVLMRQMVPPVANYKEKDEYLGDLKISKGGPYACRYALRFAAGFGSQVAFALYATAQYQ